MISNKKRNKIEMKKLIVPMVLFMIAIAGFLFPIFFMQAPVHSEYSAKTEVDRPDMVENAISNAMSELRRRDFVPVNLRVNWHPVSKTYIIYAGGIDRTKLCKYEP